jgi:hypothetical protein
MNLYVQLKPKTMRTKNLLLMFSTAILCMPVLQSCFGKSTTGTGNSYYTLANSFTDYHGDRTNDASLKAVTIPARTITRSGYIIPIQQRSMACPIP